MRDLTGYANFFVEACEHAAVACDVFGKEFQGYGLTELQIVCAVDLAHAAFPQQPYDAITLGQNSAWNKAAICYRDRLLFRDQLHSVVNKSWNKSAGRLLVSKKRLDF